jgi:hypothetical protein
LARPGPALVPRSGRRDHPPGAGPERPVDALGICRRIDHRLRGRPDGGRSADTTRRRGGGRAATVLRSAETVADVPTSGRRDSDLFMIPESHRRSRDGRSTSNGDPVLGIARVGASRPTPATTGRIAGVAYLIDGAGPAKG